MFLTYWLLTYDVRPGLIIEAHLYLKRNVFSNLFYFVYHNVKLLFYKLKG